MYDFALTGRMWLLAAQQSRAGDTSNGTRSELGAVLIMDWRFHMANTGDTRVARRAFADLLHRSCTAQSDCQGAELVLGELVANAARHAPGPVDLTVTSDRHGLVTLNVCDTGPSFTIASPTLPSPLSESGRGLYIIAALCPSLKSTRTRYGNKVSVVLPVLACADAYEQYEEEVS